MPRFFFLFWPSTFSSLFTFAVILSIVSRFAQILSLRKTKFGGSRITVTVSWCGFEGPDGWGRPAGGELCSCYETQELFGLVSDCLALWGALGCFFFYSFIFFVLRVCPSPQRTCKMQKNSSYVLIEKSMLVVKVSSEVFLTKYNHLMRYSLKMFFFCVYVWNTFKSLQKRSKLSKQMKTLLIWS